MARILLGVRGMDNEGARDRVQATLLAIEGVAAVEAGTDQQAAVDYDAGEVTIMDMIRALRRIGFLAGME